MKKAIILAAGIGSRLGKTSKNTPKCLLRLNNKKETIIERQIKVLKQNKIKDILILTGYKTKEIIKKIGKKARYIYFPNFRNTNNLQTLLHANKELNEEFLCLFSDVVFNEKIIKNILKMKKNIVAAIDTGQSLPGTMRIKKKKNMLLDIGSHLDAKNSDGNFIGICKFNRKGARLLKKALIKEKNNNTDYYTLALRKIIIKKYKVNFYDCKNYFWKEIDDIKDYTYLKNNYKKLL